MLELTQKITSINHFKTQKSTTWKLIGHSYQIGDTGDYDGHYEITNGKISIYTKEIDEEAVQPIIDALNNSGCIFYMDDWAEYENQLLKEEIKQLEKQLTLKSSNS